MTTQILICDDSSFARKQIAKSLPSDWDMEIAYARNGIEGIEALRAGKGQILFLDLNMPEMDGYQVLQTIQEQQIQTAVIVVSGDIQTEAQNRVKALGALEFIKKPVRPEAIQQILADKRVQDRLAGNKDTGFDENLRDTFQEIANVAMGQAASMLAEVLGEFVLMPIPNVNMIEVSELQMALTDVSNNESVSAVCQGFMGDRITGEALVIFNDSSIEDMRNLLHYDDISGNNIDVEVLMDISSMLCGACLKGISDQLDLNFSQGHPGIFGQHIKIDKLFERNQSKWKRTLAVEMGIAIENRNIHCHILLLFTEDSVPLLAKILSFLDS
ncbi:MAG TPA: response regulator [Gammaproteobacteria bacterium]|nr:response regulator [Gammaproteobacteria bacterium]